MDYSKAWLVTKRDGTQCVMRTFSPSATLYNADGSLAKEVSEEEAKAPKAKKRGRPRKDKDNGA